MVRNRTLVLAGQWDRFLADRVGGQSPESPSRVEYHHPDFGKKLLQLLKSGEQLHHELTAEAEH